MNNSAEIFEIGLGLTFPWIVEIVNLETTNTGRELHICLNFQKVSKFKSEGIDDLLIHDTMECTLQHLNFFQYKYYFHACGSSVQKKQGVYFVI
jgi:hypothetical protein